MKQIESIVLEVPCCALLQQYLDRRVPGIPSLLASISLIVSVVLASWTTSSMLLALYVSLCVCVYLCLWVFMCVCIYMCVCM